MSIEQPSTKNNSNAIARAEMTVYGYGGSLDVDLQEALEDVLEGRTIGLFSEVSSGLKALKGYK